MNKSNRYIYLIFLLCFSGIDGLAQSRADSTVMNYLGTIKTLDKPFYHITKKGKKEVINSNFFIRPNDPINQRNLKIITYLFGPNVTHHRKYFLINIMDEKNVLLEKIIDNDQLKDAINEVFAIIEPYGLLEYNKAILINQLSFTYY